MADVIVEGDNNCRHGNFIWIKGDKYIGKSLRLYGEWCEPELELMRHLINRGDSVIETGANIGADTVPLAKHIGPEGHIFAFEPQPAIYAILCANLQSNHCTNATTFRAGTNKEPSVASIPALDYAAEENFGGVAMMNRGLGEEVDLVKLDDLFDPGSQIALIKADVEGMELPSLLGAARIIGENQPALYVENNLGPEGARLVQWLTEINYRCFWHTVPLYWAYNWRNAGVDHFPGIVSCNMVCLMVGDPRIDMLIEHFELDPVLGPRDKPRGMQERPRRPRIG